MSALDDPEPKGEHLRWGRLALQRGLLTPAELRRALEQPDAPANPGIRLFDDSTTTPRVDASPLPRAELRDCPVRFGRFTLESVLGEGGAGVVYRAKQEDLGRTVALKILRSEQPQQVERFLREARIAAQLNHPNLVPIYEVGEEQGRHYIAMELIDGAVLSALRVDLRRALEIVRDAARAIHFAHEQGIVHRDLKPQNIMIGRDGWVRIMDLGLARELGSGSTITIQGTVIGTPVYMSPEQAGGKRVGPASDVYSLGATLYDALTGRPPFEADSTHKILQQVRTEEPKPPRQVRRTIPSEVQTIILKAMEKSPARRYPSARQLAEDIDRFLQGLPIHARPASALYRAHKWVLRRKVVVGFALSILATAAIVWWGVSRLFEERAFRDSRRSAESAFRESDYVRARIHCARALRLRNDPELERLDERCRRRLEFLDHHARLEEEIRDARPWFYAPGLDIRKKISSVEAALSELERLMLQPELADFPAGWRNLGLGWYFVSDWTRAEEALRRALNLDPGDSAAAFTLAKLLLEEGMEDHLESGRGTHEEATAESRKKISEALQLMLAAEKGMQDPRTLDGRIARAYLAMAKNEGEECLRLCREGIAAYRTRGEMGVEEFYLLQVRFSPRTEWSGLLKEALNLRPHYPWGHYYLAHDHDHRRSAEDDRKAIEHYSAAIALHPGFSRAYYGRGCAYVRRKELAEAISDFDAAIRLRPDWPLPYFDRACAKRDSGDLAGAFADCTLALDFDPRSAKILTVRAAILESQKDTPGALADLNRALESDSNYAPAYKIRGRIYLAQNRLEDSGSDLNSATRLAPDDFEAHHLRHAVHLARNELDLSLQEITRTIELRPEDPDYYMARALVHRVRRDYAAARNDAEHALTLNPNHAGAHVILGKTFWSLGDLAGAEKALRRALELGGPDWKYDKGVEALIQALRNGQPAPP